MELITTGCSFSDPITPRPLHTWPGQLEQMIGAESAVHLGRQSQGNGLIARRLIHHVAHRQDHDNLLVGIMWSGTDRTQSYTSDYNTDCVRFEGRDCGGYVSQSKGYYQTHNEDPDSGGWLMHNPHWPQSANHYRTWDPVQGVIETFEWILYTQLIMQQHHIRYFMMCYMDQVLTHREHPAVQHLNQQIDWDQWVSTQGCWEWCGSEPDHPTQAQHTAYCEQVIVPWLHNKEYA